MKRAIVYTRVSTNEQSWNLGTNWLFGTEIKRGNNSKVYNAAFDMRMVEQSCGKYDIEPKLERFDWECAMNALAEFYGEWNDYFGGWKWQKLFLAAQ